MYIIAGLGNPGKEYTSSRHNSGYMALEYLAEKLSVKLNKLKFNSVYGDTSINGEKVMLVKPVTYMNRSGIAIAEIVKFYKIPIENLIVIYDDIDIPLSALRIRPNGSAGTHNGMKSIVESIGSEFPRIRIGIGRNDEMDLADYVLQKFSSSEKDIVSPIIEKAAEAALEIIENGIDSAMQKFNINKLGETPLI
ncbi:MAG: aminoacyl-tRNA hydrolase [Tissierellia bacterium]|jgi:PTH1 family peptidyl-tRNA hydrolase|nr:aminoacyl-tRNA hydrolase [Tissierellia bacterium]MDD3226215.1 aminoacyl-tRNA hydrolase [Tissierellia bacterium]MDD4046179.1 aminoacyl-tRNA hydrolase [Tissierellia bacterium]MDD4677691.1 aminoacyl-tRNA hydrolase [Tissierellia bacterium]